jgi:hypothetical protein
LREREIERYLVRRVREAGGTAYKWSSPGNRGVPDRLVLVPGAPLPVAVEVKAPGRKPTALQAHVHARLRAEGLPVVVIDSKERVDDLLRKLSP